MGEWTRIIAEDRSECFWEVERFSTKSTSGSPLWLLVNVKRWFLKYSDESLVEYGRANSALYDLQGKQWREETDGEKEEGAREDIQKETWTFV